MGDLLEGGTIARVRGEEDPTGWAAHGEVAPQRLAGISPQPPLAPVLGGREGDVIVLIEVGTYAGEWW